MTVIEQIALFAQPVLNTPYIRRVRRNHGLEHATIHLLNRQHFRLSGRSSNTGFVLLGNVPTEKVEAAAREALRRMKSGEHHLAVHPNCGTNLALAGILTTLVAAIGFSGSSRRSALDRFPLVMLMMMVAVLAAQPLGASVQKHITTEGDPGDMEIISISRREIQLPLSREMMTLHEIVTRNG